MSPPVPEQIHLTNAWNPTGRNLVGVPGTRLFYAHADALDGPRTYVLLGSQRHLTFVADFEGHVPATALAERVLADAGVYPHQVYLAPARGLPQIPDEPHATRSRS